MSGGADFEIDGIGRLLEKVREKQPVVHAITNFVTASDVANVLRSIGARPVMALAGEEVEEIVSKADSLLLNLGTPTPERIGAMIVAGQRAEALHKPIVFDPVGVGASAFRTASARQILSTVKVDVIKGNGGEIGNLSGMGGLLAGLDKIEEPPDIVSAASTVSMRYGCLVVVTGARDIVVDRKRSMVVENGHPLMACVTGTGCMLGAVIAAFAALDVDRMTAAVAAVVCFGLAGELAAAQSGGAGSFKTLLFDSLYRMTARKIREGAKIAERKG